MSVGVSLHVAYMSKRLIHHEASRQVQTLDVLSGLVLHVTLQLLYGRFTDLESSMESFILFRLILCNCKSCLYFVCCVGLLRFLLRITYDFWI